MPTGWLPKARLLAERLTADAVPVPDRLTVWGLPLALSLMLTEAVRLPLAVGVKVTLMVQLPPAATELPHVLVWAKSPALVPAIATLVRVKVALPSLVKVADRGALALPTLWLPKRKAFELKAKPGAVAGTSSVLPAPPQDMEPSAMAMQAVARIRAFRQSRLSCLACVRDAWRLCLLPA